MSPPLRPRLGVVLVNLGTPDAPTAAAVRKYLRQFLSDPRVIEAPRLLWWCLLNLVILPFRPRRVARLYAAIWQDDSPMRQILHEQCAQLADELDAAFPEADIHVVPAMTYGQPALTSALASLQAAQVEKIVVLPLFPQYSATSSAAAVDALGHWLAGQRNLPALTVIKDYFAHPLYLGALAASVEAHWAEHGRSEKLLFSFHGIPQAYADKGDPYPERCRVTAAQVAERLRLPPEAWAVGFQSRFGRQAWVQPYTDELLLQWAQAGVASVQVIAPAFAADCLETLEEIAGENRERFLHAGGDSYQYIPALNARPDHIALFAALVKPHLAAHLQV